MNRKRFIQAQGATCDNWIWSWSFINSQEKVVIFGAWDKETEGNTTVILRESWQTDDSGKRRAGYKQSREHIRLIEEEGYMLKTFPMIHSDANKDKNGLGPAKIKDFVPELTERLLLKVGNDWCVSNEVSTHLPKKSGRP